jgi:hypothetical protein
LASEFKNILRTLKSMLETGRSQQLASANVR